MSGLVNPLVLHGAVLLAGATVLLVVGSVGGAMARGPIHRQRIGEFTVLGVLVWLLLACVPLRRPGLDWLRRSVGVEAFRLQPARSSKRPFRESIEHPGAPQDAEPIDPARADTLLALAATAESFAIERPAEPVELKHTARSKAWGVDAVAAKPATGASDGWQQYAATVYAVGAAAALVWLQVGWMLLIRIVRSSASPDAWLEELYRSLPYTSRRRRPRLVVSGRCRHAFSFGIWQPTIILPADGCTHGRTGQVRHVLLHELGHAAQRDAWGNFVLNAALPLLYLHPLYWWLRRQVRVARELIADDWAARHSTKEAYAEDLLALVKARGRFRLNYLGILGMSAPRTQFYRRMEMLLQREQPLSTRCSGVWRWLLVPACAAVVAVMVLAVGTERSSAQEGETEATVEQAEPDERDSESVTNATESAQDQERKQDVDRLQQERDMLRAQLEDLRKRMVELEAQLDARRERPIEKRVRELDLEGQTAQARKQAKEAKTQALRAVGDVSRIRAIRDAQRSSTAQAAAAARAQQEALWAQLAEKNDARKKQVDAATAERVARYQEAFEAQVRVGAALGRGRNGSQSDLDALVNLAAQYVNAQSEVAGAEARLRKMKATNERVPNTFDETEVDAVAIQLDAAQRKLSLFRAIAEALLEATEAEIQTAHENVQDRELSPPEQRAARSQLAQAEAKRRILHLILQ